MKNKSFNLRLVIFSLCLVLFLAVFLSLRVSAEQTEKIGDAYTDGSINTKDAIYVLQYLAYMVDVEDTELYVLNTYVNDNNEDGSPKINAKDALILLQYLAEMDVELGVGDWTLAKEPTLQETGLLKRNEASGFSEYVLPTLNETDYSAIITKKALCFETGVKTYTYTKDKNSFNFSASIPKIDCISVTDKAVAPTCTETGLTEGSHCEMCNKVFVAQQSVPATGHTEVVDSATEATCTSEGKTEGRHCSACQQIFVAQQTIAKKPHSYSATDWKCTACAKRNVNRTPRFAFFLFSSCQPTKNHAMIEKNYRYVLLYCF